MKYQTKMKKVLAIIGSHEGQQFFIEKAKEMGVETHCFAWDKGIHSLCKDIADYFHPISALDKEKILEVCREIKIDGVFTRISLFIPTACYIAQEMNLPGNKYTDSFAMINKYLQRQVYLKYRVSSPRFVLAEENIDLSEFIFPLIVKPVDCFASYGVMKVEQEEDLAKAIQRAQELSYAKQALIEEYVTGAEVSVETISWNGKHYILTITDKENTGEPYFVETAHHEPSLLSDDIQEKIKIETRKALTALNFNYGTAHVEIKITETGKPYLIEVNARMGGGNIHELVRLSTGYDLAKGAIDLALNQFEEPVITMRKHAGIYFLSKGAEWVKQIIDNKASDPDIVAAEIYDDQLYELQSSYDRSGYFIYQSDRKRRWNV